MNNGDINQRLGQYYFVIVKMIYTLIIFGYILIYRFQISYDIMQTAKMLVFFSMIISLIWLYEILEHKKLVLLSELIIFLISYRLIGESLAYILPIVISDAIASFELNMYFRFTPIAGVLLADEKYIYFMLCVFTIFIYIQHYDLILIFRRTADNYEEQERLLKDSIDINSRKFKQEIERTGLYYENMVLQDKAELSQELHDKLGHRINGSIYQLEACKMLMHSDPQRTEDMLTRIIVSLRTGMDDIRAMLRREKPSNQRLARIKLANLCEECRSQYGIDASLEISGDSSRIPDNIWSIFLDNCCECVTNALKYSECSKIKIQILVLNKMIRCSINDNGKGCEMISEGMGIQGIKRRIIGVGGIVDVDGRNGFMVNMIVPIEGDLSNGNKRNNS